MLYSGQVLQERYQLQQKLGQNAGCQTWLAVDLATPSWGDSSLTPPLVIIKLLALRDEVYWNDFKLFEREVKVLKHLNHPQIPQYWDDFCIQERWLWFGIVLSNRVGIGLLAWVPIIGFWTAIALGVKGNEWAWQSRKWQSIDQFKNRTRKCYKQNRYYRIAIN